MRRGFLRVGIDAMRDFQAVNVCVVLNLPAYSTANGLCNNIKYGEDQKEHRNSRPVAQAAHVPALLKARKRPICNRVQQVKAKEHSYGKRCHSNHNMIQYVVSHFMANYKKRFRNGRVLERSIPDND